MAKKFAELRAMDPVPPMVSTLGPLSEPGRDCAPIEVEVEVEDVEDVVVKEERRGEEATTTRSALPSPSLRPASPSSSCSTPTRSSRSSVAGVVTRRSNMQPLDDNNGCRTCTCKCTDLLARVENLEKEVLVLRRELGLGLGLTPQNSTRRSQVLQLTPKSTQNGGRQGTLHGKRVFCLLINCMFFVFFNPGYRFRPANLF